MTSAPVDWFEELPVESSGGRWLLSCHPPDREPDGTPHGASAWCLAPGGVVLVSGDGERYSWPGGRPEPTETWEDTLRREVAEEACAGVVAARCLGFSRSRCVDGPEAGLVLVRSIWRAEVRLDPWDPRHEIRARQVVAPGELREHLWIEPGFEPAYERWLLEAALQ